MSRRAPQGAPNVLVVLYVDTGCAAWSRYGGRIEMPTMQRLADNGLELIRDSRQSEPEKPWYLWFCPGANHAPHHASKEYIHRYRGRFDNG